MMNQLNTEINKLKQGNFQDYEIFYDLTSNYIYKIIRDLVSDVAISDQIMSTTYNQIYQTINSLVDNNSFFMWAGRIATDECIKYLSASEEKTYEFVEAEGCFSYANVYEDFEEFIPESILTNIEIQRIIQDTIDAMPIICKLVMQCFYYEGMSVGEIANKLNISDQQVRDTVSYIKKTLKDIINGVPYDKNTRLYSLAQVPFFWIVFKNVVDFATTGAIGGAVASGAVSAGGAASGATPIGGAASGAAPTGGVATGGTPAASGVANGGAVLGAKGTGFFATMGGKIAAGIVATAVIGIGGVAIYNAVTDDDPKKEKESFTFATTTDATPSDATLTDATPTDVVEEIPVYEGINEIYNIDINTINTVDSRTTLFDGSCDIIHVESEAYPVLAANVSAMSDGIYAEYEDTAASLVESAISMESMGNDYGTSIYENIYVERADNIVLSLRRVQDYYGGGPHGYVSIMGYTYDVETGQPLKLSDLGDVKEDIKIYLQKYFYENMDGGEYLETDKIPGYIDDETVCWYLTGDGVRIVFNQYDIGPYAAGIFDVTVPFSALPGINEKYKFSGGMSGIGNATDIDGDGISDSIQFNRYVYGDYQTGYTGIDIIVNGQTFALTNLKNFTNISFYSYRSEDMPYGLVISTNFNYESPNIILCKLTTIGVEILHQLEGYELGYWVEDVLHLTTTVNILGSYSAERLCKVENNQFVFLEDRYILCNSVNAPDRQGVITKVELPIKLEEDGLMVDSKLQAGTTIYPINTDTETVVGFYLEDGTYGEVYFEVTESGNMFDGKNEAEVFEK